MTGDSPQPTHGTCKWDSSHTTAFKHVAAPPAALTRRSRCWCASVRKCTSPLPLARPPCDASCYNTPIPLSKLRLTKFKSRKSCCSGHNDSMDQKLWSCVAHHVVCAHRHKRRRPSAHIPYTHTHPFYTRTCTHHLNLQTPAKHNHARQTTSYCACAHTKQLP